MKHIVLIPAFSRPEFLFWAIARIKLARGHENNHYIFQLDYGYDYNIPLSVIKECGLNHEIRESGFTNYTVGKQSHNLINGYLYAYKKAKETGGLVIMIEEDIMISTDFFEFHEKVHAQEPNIFCCLSTSNHNRIVRESGDESEYYESTKDYCSLGVSFKPEIIEKYLVPHFTQVYLRDPVGYCKKHFPESFIGDYFAEQDGLIRRLQHQSGLPTVYPFVPKAYHAGFYGYNRKTKLKMPFAKRIDYVGAIIFSEEEMRKNAGKPEWFDDSSPVKLQIEPQEKYIKRNINLTENELKV